MKQWFRFRVEVKCLPEETMDETIARLKIPLVDHGLGTDPMRTYDHFHIRVREMLQMRNMATSGEPWQVVLVSVMAGEYKHALTELLQRISEGGLTDTKVERIEGNEPVGVS